MDVSMNETPVLGRSSPALSEEDTRNEDEHIPTFEVAIQDQTGIHFELTKSICEEFHRLSRENAEDMIGCFNEVIDRCEVALHKLHTAAGKPDAKVQGTLKQLRSELDAYHIILLTGEMEDRFEDRANFSQLARECAHDDTLRQLVILLRWSEDVANREPGGFADLCRQQESFENIYDVKGETLHALKRGGDPGGLRADLDGKSVKKEEETIDRLYRTVFAMLRCGKVAEAGELLCHTGVPCLAPLLSMRAVLEREELTPLQPATDSPYAKVLQKRKLFKRTVAKLLGREAKGGPEPLRMLWAALAGRVEPLLSLATKTEDRIWVLANAAVEARLDELEEEGGVVGDAPGSVKTIFEEVLPHESWPYFPLFLALLIKDSAGAVRYAATYIADNEESNKSMPEHLLRFMAHLVVFFRNNRMDHDIHLGNRVILKYTGRLFALSLTHLIPFYASYIKDATARQVILQTMYRIRSATCRLEFLEAVKNAGMNYRPLCKQIAVKSRQDESSSPSDLIDRFRWLLYKEAETQEDALIEACVLLRKFLVAEDDDSLRALLGECGRRDSNLADRVRARIERSEGGGGGGGNEEVARAIEEYTAFVYYVTGLDAFDAWRAAHAEKAKEELRKDASMRGDQSMTGSSMVHNAEEALEGRRKSERWDRVRSNESLLRQKAVDVLLTFIRHPGWREDGENGTAFYGDPEDERERSTSLRALRDRCFASALLRIAQMHAEGGDAEAALETATLVCALRLDKDISKRNLRTFLAYVHRVAGHTLK